MSMPTLNQPFSMRRFALFLLPPVLLVAGWAAWQWADQPAESELALEQRYRLAPLTVGPIVQSVAATGTLNPVVLVNVGTQISGRIRNVFVDFNQPVQAGQLLAELDPSLIEAQLAQLQANFAEVRTQNSVAQRKLARSEDLAGRGFISPAQVEDDRQAVELSSARMRAIEAQLSRERTNLSLTAIRSPIDGVVIARSVDIGQTVAASFQTPTLFLIARDLRDMQIDTNVAEADVAHLKVGMSARFRVDALGERDFVARVRQIRLNPKIEQNVVTYNVVLATRNDDGRLLPGMTANVSIEVARRETVLRVPNLALRFRPGDGAPVIDEPGSGPSRPGGADARDRTASLHLATERDGQPVLVRRLVRLGITDGSLTEILAPERLSAEDRVAVGEIVGASSQRQGGFRLRLF
jgi:HlyD family secretion protein